MTTSGKTGFYSVMGGLLATINLTFQQLTNNNQQSWSAELAVVQCLEFLRLLFGLGSGFFCNF
jgi:hypothetical protein